jgi:hypothetical protein
MGEVTRGVGKKWGMENYSIESIREVVYVEWRMGEMVNWGEREIRQGGAILENK